MRKFVLPIFLFVLIICSYVVLNLKNRGLEQHEEVFKNVAHNEIQDFYFEIEYPWKEREEEVNFESFCDLKTDVCSLVWSTFKNRFTIQRKHVVSRDRIS